MDTLSRRHVSRLKARGVDYAQACPVCQGPSFVTPGGTRTCLDCYHEWEQEKPLTTVTARGEVVLAS